MDRLIRVSRRAFLSAGVFTAVARSAGSCVSVLQLADAPTTANGGTDVYSIPGLDKNGSHNSGPDLTLGPSHTIIFSPCIAASGASSLVRRAELANWIAIRNSPFES
jgi:hypothetical protein